MKFLPIWTPDARTTGVPPGKEHMSEMGKLIEEAMKAGELLATGALLPISKGGASVRSSGGKITVTATDTHRAIDLLRTTGCVGWRAWA